MHMLTVMIVGLAMGSTVCIGQSVGGNDLQKAGRQIGNTFTLFVSLSLVLTVLLFGMHRADCLRSWRRRTQRSRALRII